MLSLLVELTLWRWNTDGIKLHCVALWVAVTWCWTVYESKPQEGVKGILAFSFFVFYIKHSIENTINFPQYTRHHSFTLTCLKSKTFVHFLTVINHIHNLFTVASLTWRDSFETKTSTEVMKPQSSMDLNPLPASQYIHWPKCPHRSGQHHI